MGVSFQWMAMCDGLAYLFDLLDDYALVRGRARRAPDIVEALLSLGQQPAAHHLLAKQQIRAAAYWRRGDSAVHENLDTPA
jgi:hypothetical protein